MTGDIKIIEDLKVFAQTDDMGPIAVGDQVIVEQNERRSNVSMCDTISNASMRGTIMGVVGEVFTLEITDIWDAKTGGDVGEQGYHRQVLRAGKMVMIKRVNVKQVMKAKSGFPPSRE